MQLRIGNKYRKRRNRLATISNSLTSKNLNDKIQSIKIQAKGSK